MSALPVTEEKRIRKRSWLEIVALVLAVIFLVASLAAVAFAVLFMIALANWGSNK